MKKSLFFIMLCALYSLNTHLSAQTTFVTGSATVMVKPATLLYNGGGLQVTNADAKITNQGNIKVAGTGTGNEIFSVANDTSIDEFILYEDPLISLPSTSYGQLIIASNIPSTGKINLQKKVPNTGQFVAIGLPFTNYMPVSNLFTDTGNASSWTNPCAVNIPCGTNRYNSTPVFVWDNQEIEFDPVQPGNAFDPTKYYIVNKFAGSFAGSSFGDNNTQTTFKGIPNNVDTFVTLYSGSTDRGNKVPSSAITDRSTNHYNSYFQGYIFDGVNGGLFTTKKNDAWGKTFNQFANPYTSNFDLSFIGYNENNILLNGQVFNDDVSIADLAAVEQPTGGLAYNSTAVASGIVYTSANAKIATTRDNGSFGAGDADALLVKPGGTFVIYLKNKEDYVPSQPNVNIPNVHLFNDKLKTFGYTARVTYAPGGSAGTIPFSNSFSNSTNSDDNIVASGDVYQVELQLWDAGKNLYTGTNTYVALGKNLLPGYRKNPRQRVEIANGSIAPSTTAIYTKQEIAGTHGVDPAYANINLYINQINHAQAGIPIPVFFNRAPGDNIKYKFKADLAKNLVRVKTSNFDNPYARFYFRDKELNKIVPIDKNFEYEFEQATSTGNRFEIFVGMINTIAFSNNKEEQAVEKSVPQTSEAATSVYKDKIDIYNIRFDKRYEKANVNVYNSVGQIVHVKNDINTSSDYALPLSDKSSSSYIVKIEYLNGETVTKKIID